MEQSAFEAVMIGVNVFVFIAALSAGILLMSNVIDMVNFANEQAIVGMNGTLAESVGVVNERIYTGAQMLNYYRDIIKSQTSATKVEDNVFYVRLSDLGQEKALKNFVESEVLSKYLNEEFILEYKGIINEKNTYVFSLKAS